MINLTGGPRRINWNRAEQILEPEPPVVQTTIAHQDSTQTTIVQVKHKRNRQGNGHKSEKVRKFSDSERDWLRNAFLHKNGQIEEDDCVDLWTRIPTPLSTPIARLAIFQITGFISVLHRYVALGRLEVRDLPAYVQWMQTKYSGLWTQYNNPRFVTARNERKTNLENIGSTIVNNGISDAGPVDFSTTPNFKAFKKRGWFNSVLSPV